MVVIPAPAAAGESTAGAMDPSCKGGMGVTCLDSIAAPLRRSIPFERARALSGG
jgi:hypothetical protein